MATAVIYPQPGQRGRGHKEQGKENAKKLGISDERLRQARTVLHCADDLVPLVISAAMTLDKAYEEAQQRKNASESKEARFARVQAEAPDLADLIREERLTLEAAEMEIRNRKEIRKNQREAIVQDAQTIAAALAGFSTDAFEKLMHGFLEEEEFCAALRQRSKSDRSAIQRGFARFCEMMEAVHG